MSLSLEEAEQIAECSRGVDLDHTDNFVKCPVGQCLPAFDPHLSFHYQPAWHECWHMNTTSSNSGNFTLLPSGPCRCMFSEMSSTKCNKTFKNDFED